eukprot:2032751-Lingulodinium_polyedra.AAC.1
MVELERAPLPLQEPQAPLHCPGAGHGPVAEGLLAGRLLHAAPRAPAVTRRRVAQREHPRLLADGR